MEAIFMGAITWAIKCLIEDYFKPHQGGYSYSR